MLTPYDDLPIHQTPEPIAQPSTGDRNFYDRYFFNGYRADGELYFAAAWGLYPNRFVQDAAFSVVRGGEQISVHASRRAPQDRTDLRVGPIEIQVLEPLKKLRVTVGPNESGIEADVTFTNVTVPMQEPRFTRLSSQTRVVMDYTRLTQFGAWDGWISVDGERIEVKGAEVLGSRDRSWGIRGVGERDAGAPGMDEPQFFWLWAPLSFDDTCVHFDVQEDADGRRWHWNGELATMQGSERARDVDWHIDWKRGTRRAEHASVDLRMMDGTQHHIELEPIVDFQMLGIGYMHPQFSHGTWLGDEAVLGERWKLADLDPMAFPHLHVQALCTARSGDKVGVGILEQLVIGRHLPSGFTQLLDAAQ